MCTTIDKFNADTACNYINELVKNQNESVGKMKLCVDRDLNCG